nr:uncharacterized protein LOC109160849 [Ipomoea trifida]
MITGPIAELFRLSVPRDSVKAICVSAGDTSGTCAEGWGGTESLFKGASVLFCLVTAFQRFRGGTTGGIWLEEFARQLLFARLEKLVQQLLTSQGKQPVQEEDSIAATQTEGVSTATDIGDHHPHFSPYPKVDFPLLSSEEDPMVWLLRCESSFRHTGTLDHDRVPLAAHHMIGEAQVWYHSEIAVSPFTS